ncbi:MAG: SPOCS domain-containing protein [Tissierellales bacterium]
MAVELIKDLLKIDQVVGKDEIQALVEGEIRVPDTKPRIKKLLKIDGDVEVTGTKIAKGKIIVNGIVNFNVLYSADDELQSVHSLEARTDFREEIEIQGVNEGAATDIKANVEHIDYDQDGDASISVKTVISLAGKATHDNTIDIIKDIKGSEGIQVLKESIRYNDVMGTNTSSTLIKEAFELEEQMPDIIDILRIDTKVYESETKVVEDKVIVAGLVACSIMYFGDDDENKVNYINHEIPFTHFVELPGALKDMSCGLKLTSLDTNFEVKEDINGSLRIIDIESTVKVNAKAYRQVEKEVAIDTYSTNKILDIKKQEVVVSESIGQSTSKETIRGVLEVGNEIIRSIYNISGKSLITDYKIMEGKVIVEGLLEVDMLYQIEENDEIKDTRQDIPFKTYVDIEQVEDELDIEVSNDLEQISYKRINSREVELEATVNNYVSVNRIKKINIITEAIDTGDTIDRVSRPSITIYIVQKDDTIWDIAKRYNTTVEDIIKANDIVSPENIMPGEKIIIDKNVSFDL